MEFKNIKNLLIVCTAFSPERAVGSIRLTKIVKFLVREGYQITVISPSLHEGSKIDNSLEYEELKAVKRVVIPQGILFSKIFLRRRNSLLNKQTATEYIKSDRNQGIIKRIKAQLFRFLHFGYTIIRNSDWRNQVVKYAHSHFDKGQFDIVFSSYPSLGAHWSAKALKKQNYVSKWVADFRDPLNYETNSNFLLYYLLTKLQNNILKHTNIVTFTSMGLAKKFNADDSGKFVCLPNGIDYDDIEMVNINQAAHEDQKILSFCYVGSLYGGERDLSILFVALNKLIEFQYISIDDVRIVYAGKEFNVLKQQASKYNLAPILVDKGFVDRRESLMIQQLADITIVVTWNTKVDSGIVPGKLYECFVTHKTILGLVNGNKPNSELKQMINDVNGGYVFEDSSVTYEEDFNCLLTFLKEKYIEKRNLKKLSDNYNSNVNVYSYENVVKRLDGIFHSLFDQ